MRIAFINPQGNFDRADSYLTEHPDFGGQLVYVKELSLAMARTGVKVDILTRRIEDPQFRGFTEPLDDFGELTDQVRIVRLPFGGERFLAKEKLWPHLPEFVEAIMAFYADDGPPDYLTAHYADGAWAAVRLRQRMQRGFTLTGHSLGAQKMDKLGVNAENFTTMDARYHFARRLAAEREGMCWADTIVTSTREERLEQYGHPLYSGAVETGDDDHFRVIPPGINSRIFNRDPKTDDPADIEQVKAQLPWPDQPHVVVSSRLDPKKNLAGVIEAFARCQPLVERARLALFVRGLDDPWRDRALGHLRSDEREVLVPLLERIEAAGLRDRTHFINVDSQRRLACAYRLLARSGSVFALPSLFEPFGLAPIEAAACGLAVAATRNGGPLEVFADGVGELFDPSDPDEIATGLLSALNDQQRLADRASRRITERYTWDRTAGDYLETITANRQGSPRTCRHSAGLNQGFDQRLNRYLQSRPGPNQS